jgi:hypothetical protein
MRLIVGLFVYLSFVSVKAQTMLPVPAMNYMQTLPSSRYNQLTDTADLNTKWHFSRYTGISTGYIFLPGGNTGFLSVPMGLQLNRRLNNNLYAFAGVSVAPVFFNFNRSFLGPALNKNFPGGSYSSPNGFGFDSRVEMGLMYINDAKTFSISGSISVDRGSYPIYPTNSEKIKK